MKKIVLKGEDMTVVHFNILSAIKLCSTDDGGKRSHLTATCPTALLHRILPDEMKLAKGDYVKAMRELHLGHWVLDNSLGRITGLARYWISDEADVALQSHESRKSRKSRKSRQSQSVAA